MRQKRKSRRRILAAAITLSLLYVLSSGPTYAMTLTYHVRIVDDGSGDRGVNCDFDPAPWWPTLYAPLLWVAEQSWGDVMIWYWHLFPVNPPE
jgi:hypothetical protein